MFGSIDLTYLFNIKSEEDINPKLRPYLFKSSNGKLRLNLIVKNKKEMNGKYTHEICAAKKGVDEKFTICDIVDYYRDSGAEPQPAPQPKTEQKREPKPAEESGNRETKKPEKTIRTDSKPVKDKDTGKKKEKEKKENTEPHIPEMSGFDLPF